jgi:hypothetical protein
MNEEYSADVTFRIELPTERVEDFAEAITSLTHGLALIELLSQKE